MKKTLVLLVTLLNFNIAMATTINFDDLVGDLSPVADGYSGLNWNNSNTTGVIDATPYFTPGVDYTGIASNVLFNAYGFLGANTTAITATNGGAFDFLSGYWSAGLAGNGSVQFEGYTNNQLIFSSRIFNLDTSSVSPIVLNWLGIDSFNILSSANIWIADNLEVNLSPSAVPLPGAFWFFASSILGFTAVRKRKIL